MIYLLRKFFLFLISLFLFNNSYAKDSENIHMLLEKGLVVIETYSEKAPKTVARVKELINKGFFCCKIATLSFFLRMYLKK